MARMIPRQNRRLCQARENGYLDARRLDAPPLLQAYGLWCWRMKLPMVWYERRSPRSRFGRLHVDLMTTREDLSANLQSRLTDLGAIVSSHDAHWDRILLAELPNMARSVFRDLRQGANYRRKALTLVPMNANRRVA